MKSGGRGQPPENEREWALPPRKRETRFLWKREKILLTVGNGMC